MASYRALERVSIIAPALIGVAFLLAMFLVYCVRCATGNPPSVIAVKHNQVLGPFLARFLLWLLGPVERLLLGRVSANAITTASFLLCVGAAFAVAYGRLATGAWLYALGGILDLLDGRLARASGTQSAAGALFDSVSDRWAELAVFTGYIWYLRDSAWMLAAMLAVSASMMVSYTRARGEGLGLNLSGGAMQRAERIILVAVGTVIGAWLAAGTATREWAPTAIGIAMLLCGALSGVTALGRWRQGYRSLLERDLTTSGTSGQRGKANTLATPTAVASLNLTPLSVATVHRSEAVPSPPATLA